MPKNFGCDPEVNSMMETRDKIKNSQFKKETDLKETKAFDEQPAVNLEKTKKILEPF